jgi:hypothetical protein
VLTNEGSNEYAIQKVGEGVRIRMQVHADRLIRYHDVMELDKRGVTVEAADGDDKETYEVEKIVDHEGSNNGTTQTEAGGPSSGWPN